MSCSDRYDKNKASQEKMDESTVIDQSADDIDIAHRLHSNRRLERLPNVLLHLCMQSLDFISLTRFSRTCKFIAATSLHPSAGRFLLASSFAHWQDSILSICHRGVPQAHGSTLFRAHAPMILSLPTSYLKFVSSMQHRTIQFGNIQTIDGSQSKRWKEEQLLPLLQQLQSVTLVKFTMSSIWSKCKQVQIAVCQLPHLTKLTVRRLGNPNRIDPDAMAMANHLTQIRIERLNANDLTFLSAASHLTHLELIDIGVESHRWSELVHLIPNQLNQLINLS